MKNALVKPYFGVLAAVVLLTIPTDIYLATVDKSGLYQYAWERFLNSFFFFTIMSNILVGVTSFLLFRAKNNESLSQSVLQFCSFLCILVTGIVYHVMLAADLNPTGLNAVTNFFLHTFVPTAYVLGWLFLVPRGRVTTKVLIYSLAIPVCWLIFTLIKGPIVGFYPYPFMDVNYLGYTTALINVLIIFIAALLLALFLKWLDNKLA